MSFVLYSMLKRIPASDPQAQLLRARLCRYLEGPLPALASGLQENAHLRVVDATVPEPCAWWHVEPGAWVGLPSSSLDFLVLFRELPDLPSGPDNLWARLAADRPLAFSRAIVLDAEKRAPLFTLTCLIQSTNWHMLFYYAPEADMYSQFLPVPSAASHFSFECALSADSCRLAQWPRPAVEMLCKQAGQLKMCCGLADMTCGFPYVFPDKTGRSQETGA